MDNLARRLEGGGAVLGTKGTVIRKEGSSFAVALADGGEVAVRRAASCLLEPSPGDAVLVGAAADEAWILAVLDRDAARAAELTVDGDLRLRTARGKIALVAQHGVDLISAGPTKVVTNGVELKTTTASVLCEGLDFVGGWVTAEVERAKLLAESLDQVVDRFSQRVKRSFRSVEELDQKQAGAVHHRVERTMRVHAHDTAMTADGLVKIDGKQIHVG
jgi:hypothetical protein